MCAVSLSCEFGPNSQSSVMISNFPAYLKYSTIQHL